MVILRAEHPIPDFDEWKQSAFDKDPLDRKASVVVGYRTMQPADNPNYVIIDLEFNTSAEAETFLSRLRVMWSNVTERFGWTEEPKAIILNLAEAGEN